MKSCVVIYNPNSGHILRKSMIPTYKDLIEKHGYSVKFIATQYKGHAKEIVSHIGYVDLVISMGGDGTFNEIVFGISWEPSLMCSWSIRGLGIL